MKKADELRKIADDCTKMARQTKDSPRKKRLERLAEGWDALAKNQAWLDGDPPDKPKPKAA